MEAFYSYSALIVLAIMGVGMVRVIKGPAAADRMVAAQLVGTLGVADLLLLSRVLDIPAFRNVALVFALLAIVLVTAFVRTSYARAEETGGGGDGSP